jgi:hypothetical protein
LSESYDYLAEDNDWEVAVRASSSSGISNPVADKDQYGRSNDRSLGTSVQGPYGDSEERRSVAALEMSIKMSYGDAMTNAKRKPVLSQLMALSDT